MAGKNDIVAGIKLDGEKEYKEGLTGINKELRATQSELSKVSAQYEGQANTVEALGKKQEVLNRILDGQEKKVKATRAALDHADESYKKVEKGVEEVRKELEKEEKTLKEVKKQYGNTSDEAKRQQERVDELAAALARGENNYRKAADRCKDWQTKLNTAEAQVIRATKAVNVNNAYLQEAEESTDGLATSIDNFGKKAKEAAEISFSLGDSLKHAIVEKAASEGMDLLAQGAEAVKDAMIDTSKASAQLTASTGLSETSAKRYQSVMRQIKGDNFGEDYQDVSAAMAEIIQTMGELDNENMTEVTESAITLRDTFGFDYKESIRSAKMLMDQFGVSGKEAFNLIVQGAQQGLNKNDDLLDVINEYSVHYAQMGLNANEFFNSLKNGTETGTFSVDKLGDAYKEFGIRVKDTTTTTTEAYDLLGLDADAMRSKFAEGGESAKQATNDVLTALFNMDDQVKQNQAGVDLFGTMWEDLGIAGIEALTDIEGGISSANNAMDKLKKVRFSDVESSLKNLGSKAQEYIVAPIADKAIPVITGLANAAAGALEDVFDPPKTQLQEFIEEIEQSNAEVNTSIQNAKNIMSGADEDVSALEAYKDTLLSLNAETEKTEFQKYQIKAIVDELSGSIPELAAAWDEETGSLQLTNEELASLIENQQALVMQQAILDAQKESMEAVAEATLNKARADSAAKQAAEDLTKADGEYRQAIQDTGTEMNEYYGAMLDAQIASDEATDAQEKANKALEESEKQLEAERKALEELPDEYKLSAEGAEELGKTTDELGNKLDETGKKFDEFGNDISNLTPEQAEAVTEETRKIVEAYEGMRDSIADSIQNSVSLFDEFSGGAEVSADQMLKNLESQISGLDTWSQNMKTLAEQAGTGMSQELYDRLAEMGPEAANLVQELVNTLENDTGKFEEISQKYSEALKLEGSAETIAGATSIGKQLTENISLGVTESQTNLTQATQDVVTAGAESAAEKAPEYQTAGTQAATQYSAGIETGKSQVIEQARQMAAQALSAARTYQGGFYSAGYNSASGMADGIRAGQYGAINAAADMARQALAAAKRELDINSPSKKFRKEVGQNVSESTAFGIKDKASLAGKEASKMSSQVFNKATEWIDKYRKKNKTTIEDERYFWKEVLKHVKVGTDGYEKALKNYEDLKMKNSFGVSWFSGKGKDRVKKDAAEYYGEVYQAASDNLDKLQEKQNKSIKWQIKYWQGVQKQLRTGTQAYRDAQAEIESLNDKIGTVDNMSDVLSNYKTYWNMSEQAEVEYWDIVRKNFAAGTQERIEADQEYFDAKEQLVDKLKDLEDDYKDKVAEVSEKIADQIADLNKEYENALKSRTDAIQSAYGLFEEFESESADGKTLLFNIKTQVAGYEDWMKQLDILSSKGILDEGLIEQLKEQGPELSATLHALNSLSRDELEEYNDAYLKKLELSQQQAEKDTADLKASVAEQTAQLKAQEQQEKQALLAAYNKSVASVNTHISSEMKTIATNTRQIAEDQTAAIVAAIKEAAGLKAGAEGSTGVNVSQSTMASVGIGSTTSSGGTKQNGSTGKEDKILKIINAGPDLKKLSNKEKEEHSPLFVYIQEQYKKQASKKMYRQLGDALGVKVSDNPKSDEKNDILKKLKKKGYRNGGRGILESVIWMDEELDTVGPELVVSRRDNAMLTRIPAGSDVIDARTTSNLVKWGRLSPDAVRLAIEQAKNNMASQQAALRDYVESVNYSAAVLNDMLVEGMKLQTPITKTERLEGMMENMLTIMQEYFPFFAQPPEIILDGRKVAQGTAGEMSTQLAMRGRRRRK